MPISDEELERLLQDKAARGVGVNPQQVDQSNINPAELSDAPPAAPINGDQHPQEGPQKAPQAPTQAPSAPPQGFSSRLLERGQEAISGFVGALKGEVPVSFDPNDTVYDVESDLLVPGASFAHNVMNQFVHGAADLEPKDPYAIDWDDNIDWQLEAVGKELINGMSRTGRGIGQKFFYLGQIASGTRDFSEAFMKERAIAERSGATRWEAIDRAFKESAGKVFEPLVTTPGGMDREDFLEEFQIRARQGKSSKLIELVQEAQGRELTTSEKNQLTAQFEVNDLYRSLASRALTEDEHKQMLKYTADRWANPNVPFLFGRFDMEMDTEVFWRRSISEAQANGQYLKAHVLQAEQSVANIAPVFATMWATGYLGAIGKGAQAADRAARGLGGVEASRAAINASRGGSSAMFGKFGVPAIVQRGSFRFSPDILAHAPKTGLTMALITPGTPEESVKTFGAMTLWASTAAWSSTLGTFGKRWAGDVLANTVVSSAINPYGEHFFQLGGMYREMARQANFESDRLGLKGFDRAWMHSLYAGSVLGPDSLFGLMTGWSGAALQPTIHREHALRVAKEHGLRRHLHDTFTDRTTWKGEEIDAFVDAEMWRLAVAAEQADIPLQKLWDDMMEHGGPEGAIRFRDNGNEITAEIKLHHPRLVQPKLGEVDAFGGDRKARALFDIAVHHKTYGRVDDFEPPAVSKEEVDAHVQGYNDANNKPDEVFKRYQEHPEFGRMLEDEGIASYEQLVDRAYESLRTDIDDGWAMLGVTPEIWKGEGLPYKDAEEAAAHMRKEGKVWIVRDEVDHPALGLNAGQDAEGLTYMDKLKAMRLYFAHNGKGHDVTPEGVRGAQAMLSHGFSDLGVLALTTEVGVGSLARNGRASLGIENASPKEIDGTDTIPKPGERFVRRQALGLAPSDIPGRERDPKILAKETDSGVLEPVLRDGKFVEQGRTSGDGDGDGRLVDGELRVYKAAGNGARQLRTVAGVEVETKPYRLNPETSDELAGLLGGPPQNMHEVFDPRFFHGRVKENADSSPFGTSVDTKSPEEFADMRMFMSEDGLVAFALKTREDGLTELVSVSRHKDAPRGSALPSLVLAIEEGAQVADAFDTVLPFLYSKLGGRVVGRTKFVDEFAPDGWSLDTYAEFNGGRPDIVFMTFDQLDRSRSIVSQMKEFTPYKKGDGQRVDEFDEGIALQTKRMKPDEASAKEPTELMTMFDDLTPLPSGTPRQSTVGTVKPWVNQHPDADIENIKATGEFWLNKNQELSAQAVKALEGGDRAGFERLLQEAGDAGLRASLYREAVEFLQGSKDVTEQRQLTAPNQPTIMAPDLADWRRGLIQKPAIPGTQEARIPKELLRGVKATRSAQQVKDQKGTHLTGRSNANNAEKNDSHLSKIMKKYRDKDITRQQVWNNLWFDMTGEAVAPIIPKGLTRIVREGPEAVINMVKEMTPDQIDSFLDGMRMTDNIRQSYASQTEDTKSTSLLSLWGALSPKASPYPHESGFMEVILGNGRMEEFINKADAGTFNLKEYLDWVKAFYPDDSGKPGAGVKNNLNRFGKGFLTNAFTSLTNGKYKGQRPVDVLHGMLKDPNVTGRKMRREFYHLLNDQNVRIGIDIKILSFMGVVAGKRDVMVIDRVQTEHLWDGKGSYGLDNMYDGIEISRTPVMDKKTGKQKLDENGIPKTKPVYQGMAQELLGHRGIALYELFEDAIAPIARDGLRGAGMPFGDMGAWHWLTWVQRSGQEVSHSTLQGLNRFMDGVEDPFVGASVTLGKFGRFFYGFRNFFFGTKHDDDFRHVYTTSDGTDFIMDTKQMKEMRRVGDAYAKGGSTNGHPSYKGKPVFVTTNKGKRIQILEEDRFMPKGFNVSKEVKDGDKEATPADRPWTERGEVNLANFDKWVERLGIRPNAKEAAIIKDGTNGTGISAPRRGGLEEHTEAVQVQAQDQPGRGLQGLTLTMTNGKKIIYLLRSGSPAAAHHEMFHATWDAIPPGQKDLLKPALAKMGINIDNEGWSNRAQEATTRMYERYLRDGQAPSPELQDLFSIVSKYMRKEYRTLRGSPIKDAISPDARAFFDQMYMPDGKVIAPHAGYLKKEEEDNYGLIEAYDTINNVKRLDPQEVGAIANDSARLRLELGVDVVSKDQAVKTASALPVRKVSYRQGRPAYRRLLRAMLSNDTFMSGKFVDDLISAWVRSGNAKGLKAIEAIQDKVRGEGLSGRDLNKRVVEIVSNYLNDKASLPSSMKDVKQQVGQTASGLTKWVKDITGEVALHRTREGFSDIPMLEALRGGDFVRAREEVKLQVVEDGVTNVNGSWDKHAEARFEGETGTQTRSVEEDGHAVLIPSEFHADDGFNHSNTSLAASDYNGKPITTYAYHPETKQLIPGRPTQTFEGLTHTLPGSRLREWVRIDVDPDASVVGTSGNREGQVEAFAVMRATDPNIRWVPDAEQVPGFRGLDGRVVSSHQFSPDGTLGEYTIQAPTGVKFTGLETAEEGNRIYEAPEFRNWQRRVSSLIDPTVGKDTFLAIDSSTLDPRVKRTLKQNLMEAANEIMDLDSIDAVTLKQALPRKRHAASRNMIQAMSLGGDAVDVVRLFNQLQDKAGLGRQKISNLDMTAIGNLKKKFTIEDNEALAAADASNLSGLPETFFRGVIESGELRFPNAEENPKAFESMVGTLVSMGKARTKADQLADKLHGEGFLNKSKAAFSTVQRLATNARYAWSRLAAETGNMKIHSTYRRMSTNTRRASNASKARYTAMFNGDNIKAALVRNGETAPSGKIKSQLYPLIRDSRAQGVIATWLGTEPGKKTFNAAQAEFDALSPQFRGVGYMMRDELRGTSAANLRRLQYHQWQKQWTRVGREWQEFTAREGRLTEEELAKLNGLTRGLLNSAPFRRKADGTGAERVPVETMLEAHNKFATGDEASFHEYLRAQGWGSREHYWLTVAPDKYDALLKDFALTGLDPLPREPSGTPKAETGGMPGAILPRQADAPLKKDNILNNLFQHMDRYETLSRTVLDGEFLRDEVNKMRHLGDREVKSLERNLKNVMGFGDELGNIAAGVAKANRWFWNSYIMNSTRLLWYTTRNKFQPYALMSSQFGLGEMLFTMPELRRQAANEGSPLRKALEDEFKSDIAEGDGFSRQALTDERADIGEIRASRLGQHFDRFMNSALPFSDKANRLEVYSMGYTMAERAVRDLRSGKIDLGDVQSRLSMLTLDGAEQLNLMSMLGNRDYEGFKREYAKTKNLNVNFAYHTGERALLIQDANSRTFASLITWPLGAAEIVVRNGMRPMVKGVLEGNGRQALQGAKSLAGYVTGMYLVGELYSLVFGDKGGIKAYHPLWSALSFTVESPGLGFITNVLGGVKEIAVAQKSGDLETVGEAATKIANRFLYMMPQLPAIAQMYEAIGDQQGVRAAEFTRSTVLGMASTISDYMDSEDLEMDMPEGFAKEMFLQIQSRLADEGYSEYRTGWESAMHFLLGTFNESRPDRWDESALGSSISDALQEAVEKGRQFMDPEEWEKAKAKMKVNFGLDIDKDYPDP
jgi:hypothetical protein